MRREAREGKRKTWVDLGSQRCFQAGLPLRVLILPKPTSPLYRSREQAAVLSR